MTDKRILIVNPNTTARMTEQISAAARAVAGPAFAIDATNPTEGPVSIEGYFDEAMSLRGLLAVIAENPRYDGYVIACFDDTGLDAARCLTNAPVVGIGEAGYHMASLVAERFAVITTLPRSVGALEHNLVRYGLKSRCCCVRASDVPVLDLEAKRGAALERIKREIEAAITEDRAEAIVLGCAGMVTLVDLLGELYGMPIIDGVQSAVKLVEGMISIGIGTSKVGGYALPRDKASDG